MRETAVAGRCPTPVARLMALARASGVVSVVTDAVDEWCVAASKTMAARRRPRRLALWGTFMETPRHSRMLMKPLLPSIHQCELDTIECLPQRERSADLLDPVACHPLRFLSDDETILLHFPGCGFRFSARLRE